MPKEKNELLEFVGGLGMLVLGLFLFSQKVIVSSGFFGAGFMIGGFSVTSGMVVIPFIIGIVWLFANFDSIGAKILIVLGVLFIIFAVILSTRIQLRTVTMFEWILMLVLTFGGLGLTAKVLFAGRNTKKHEERNTKIDEDQKKIMKKQIELEVLLEEMKRNM